MLAQLTHLYDLRLKLRGRPEAVALVDRCISLVCRAQGASDEEFAALEAEVEQLRAELSARFGAKTPRPVT